MVDKHKEFYLARKGRGAPSNGVSQRFNLQDREIDGDWLDEREWIGDSPAPLRTDVTTEFPKSIITYNQSPDLPFDRSINAYRGCEHGCVYCYARPTHAYHDLSPGLDFESRLFAKPNAADLLRRTLAKPAYRPASLAIGTNTDPYQPIEKRYRITRQILEVMLETLHPVVITTKSSRVVEDFDLLAQLAVQQLTAVAISVTSLDPQTARLLEPRAPAPARRLDAVRALSDAGIYAHVNIAPVIPGITDHEIEAIVAAAADCGAKSISFIPMRLPHEVAPLFEQWLENHYPERKAKVMSIVRQIRGGKRNDPGFHSRMRGQGPWADLIRTRIGIASRKAGIGKANLKLRTDLFRRPVIQGSQMELF
ncbi:PA0069 family radical SAM protein [Sphingorhabdus sp. 109]|jgi:DNA repair photolyase|uniref:PA0069 family radical SAM protein n=1 Tax=Sphingorhabdus sp. 109 TaxID=2653173 RepID=UPI0012F23EA9|nr:PA0069 family radical SAM protein [Sphingorhabdus sp. 109]VWX56810.1 Radical SAM superfamily protein [Sphingorhabdus sp. 109]